MIGRDEQGWRGTLRRVTFDVERVLAEFERMCFVEQCGVVGYLVVEEYRSHRLEVLPFLEWWRTTCPDEPHTMVLLEPYSQVNKWDYMPLSYR